jgi:hypothetical protein
MREMLSVACAAGLSVGMFLHFEHYIHPALLS